MRARRHRAHAGTAAAVRDAERLVQVEVADVDAEVARTHQADHGVEVGAVHVDLAAARVHQLADADDRLLEHAVGRGIGDHQRGQAVAVLRELGLEVVEIDVALVVAGHHHHVEPGHHRARGVGAVRRLRDEAHPPLGLAARLEVATDHEQAGELALRSGVGLERHRGEPGELAQHALEVGDETAVAAGLVGGRERMERAELGPRHRRHLGGGVELHGARAERDHRVGERQVLGRERVQVAQHRGLRAMPVEHRMIEEARGPRVRRLRSRDRRDRRRDAPPTCTAVEHLEQRVDVLVARGLVERDADRLRVDRAQVVAALARAVDHRRGAARLRS